MSFLKPKFVLFAVATVAISTSSVYFLASNVMNDGSSTQPKVETHVDQKTVTLKNGNKIISKSEIKRFGDGRIVYRNQISMVDGKTGEEKILSEDETEKAVTYKIFKLTSDEQRLFYYLKPVEAENIVVVATSTLGTTGVVSTVSYSDTPHVISVANPESLFNLTFFQYDIKRDEVKQVTPQQAIVSEIKNQILPTITDFEGGELRIKGLE